MPHGSGAPSPSPPRPSSKPNRDRKEQGRVSKNHRPTQRVNIRAAVQRWSEAPEDASMSRTVSGSLGAGEEFFPPPTSTPDTPASPSPPPHAAPPSWTAPARTASAPEPMDVAPPRPTTAARDMGVTHPTAATSATPRPTPRSPLRTALAHPADATAKAARAHATTSTSAPKTSHKPPSGSKTSTAPPRSKRPHQPATAPTQSAPPRAAPGLPTEGWQSWSGEESSTSYCRCQRCARPTLRASYALGVDICINQQPTRVFAFYRPPHYRLAVSDVHTLLDSPLPTIIAGDFNLKHTAWNANANTREGSRLLDD
ncbi:hypothetical protein HF086_002967, partial [Spodoptera exigua]